MSLISKEKELTKGERAEIYALFVLVDSRKIPFSEVEPILKNHSKIIEDHIKKEKEIEQRRILEIRKHEIEKCKKGIESSKQKLDKCNTALAGQRAELEDERNKKEYERDENHIKNLLWWIFNNEENVKFLEDELRDKEARLKEMENKDN